MNAINTDAIKTRVYQMLLCGVLCQGLAIFGCASSQTTPSPQSPTQQPNAQSEPNANASQATDPQSVTQTPTTVPKANTDKTDADPMLESLQRAQATNDIDAIERSARDIVERGTDSLATQRALLALAEIAAKRGAYREAILYADALIKSGSNSADAPLIKAKLYNSSHLYDKALIELDKALQIDPNNVDALAMKAKILLSFLDIDRAFESAKTAYDLSPDDCNLKILYADLLYAKKQYDNAIGIYESVSAYKRTEACLRNMAKIYEVHVISQPKACAIYRELVSIDPNNANYKASRDYQCN